MGVTGPHYRVWTHNLPAQPSSALDTVLMTLLLSAIILVLYQQQLDHSSCTYTGRHSQGRCGDPGGAPPAAAILNVP